MTPAASPSVRPRVLLVALALLAALAVALPWLLAPLLSGRLRAEAHARGLEVRWQRLAFAWPLRVTLDGLVLRHADADAPLVTATHVEAWLGPRGLSFKPRIARLVLEHAHVTLPSRSADDDTTGTLDDEAASASGPVSPRVRAAADQLAEALMLPARRLPELRITDFELQRGDSLFARFDALTLARRAGGVQFAATGVIAGDHHVPFDGVLEWDAHDRLTGHASFSVPDAARGPTTLVLHVDGRVSQDRRAGVLRVAEGTHVQVGRANLSVVGEVRRAGPRLALALAVDGLTARDVQGSLPPAVLGPLTELSVRGSWDWRASLAVDVSQPDSVRFAARVIPHGLQLGPDSPHLRLAALAAPFVAEIHIPKGLVIRDLSPANPHFRTLERISPLLQDALLTNEDGGFYHHRGFNTEAIELAMAANLRAGSFKRGAGTITMQLARNLFLGHQRTLSRKGQEVVLAWVLEHLTGLTKERLLEIYLNIIEWGPGVHGADEAARFYFDKDASEVTLEEALFLVVVVPSPTHWKNRLDASGELRPWARSQMAFIARKMVTRGWLAPEQVPDATALHVHLRGAAAEVFAPHDTTATAPGTPIRI